VTPDDDMAGIMPFASLTDAAAVATEQWGLQDHAFIAETCYKNGNSLIKTRRMFRKHFNIARHGKFPFRNPYSYG
jgi:hypothetical protein